MLPSRHAAQHASAFGHDFPLLWSRPGASSSEVEAAGKGSRKGGKGGKGKKSKGGGKGGGKAGSRKAVKGKR
eukprot:4141438-Amphidinium_carterae.2